MRAESVDTYVVLGDFAIAVPEGRYMERHSRMLRRGQKFTIRLANRSANACNCTLRIDGIEVATYRLEGKSEAQLERPTDKAPPLIFTSNGCLGPEHNSVSGENGLIEASFVPAGTGSDGEASKLSLRLLASGGSAVLDRGLQLPTPSFLGADARYAYAEPGVILPPGSSKPSHVEADSAIAEQEQPDNGPAAEQASAPGAEPVSVSTPESEPKLVSEAEPVLISENVAVKETTEAASATPEPASIDLPEAKSETEKSDEQSTATATQESVSTTGPHYVNPHLATLKTATITEASASPFHWAPPPDALYQKPKVIDWVDSQAASPLPLPVAGPIVAKLPEQSSLPPGNSPLVFPVPDKETENERQPAAFPQPERAPAPVLSGVTPLIFPPSNKEKSEESPQTAPSSEAEPVASKPPEQPPLPTIETRMVYLRILESENQPPPKKKHVNYRFATPGSEPGMANAAAAGLSLNDGPRASVENKILRQLGLALLAYGIYSMVIFLFKVGEFNIAQGVGALFGVALFGGLGIWVYRLNNKAPRLATYQFWLWLAFQMVIVVPFFFLFLAAVLMKGFGLSRNDLRNIGKVEQDPRIEYQQKINDLSSYAPDLEKVETKKEVRKDWMDMGEAPLVFDSEKLGVASELKIQLKYPSSWKLEKQEPGEGISDAYDLKSGEGHCITLFIYEVSKRPKKDKELVDEILKTMKEKMKIGESTDFKIDGKFGKRQQIKEPGMTTVETIYVTAQYNYVVLIGTLYITEPTATEADKKKVAEFFDKIVSGIKISRKG
ncbi:MAG: hypothetical protein ACAI35_22670 [Candidatus Methylacidiphilales bacterium]